MTPQIPPTDVEKSRTDVFQRLAPLLRFLGGPDSLEEIIKVVDEFDHVLNLFLPVADENANDFVRRLQTVTRNIKNGSLDVSRYVARTKSHAKRKSLKGHYIEHPHYAIYWHRPRAAETALFYRAFLASLLPVWSRLERQRLNTPEPYRDVAYKLGLFLRQLTDCNGIDRTILLALPQRAHAPSELLYKLVTLFDDHHLSLQITGPNKNWVHIRRVLEWFVTGIWETKSNIFSQKGHATRRRRPPKHGAIETETKETRLSLPEYADDVPGILVARYLPPPFASENGEQEAFDENLKQDTKPSGTTIELQPRRVTAYILANQARIAQKNGAYAAQAIELHNQNLPVGKSRLTGYELRCFIDALENIALPIWESVPIKSRSAIAAWAACRFFLSREEDDVRKITIILTAEMHRKTICWQKAEGVLRLPVDSPAHHSPGSTIRGKLTVQVHESFSIAPAGTLLECLKRLPALKEGYVYSRSYEGEFRELLARLNSKHLIDLNPSRITAVVRSTMSHLAPADEVIGHYFTGKPPNQVIPAVYSVVAESRLQALYAEACASIDQRCGRTPLPVAQIGFPLLISDDDRHVGSLHVPRPDAIRNTVLSLKSELNELENKPMVSWTTAHNRLTAYVTFFLLSTTGVRLLSTLLPAVFDIDSSTGYCFISDKDDPSYANARIIWLHVRLVEQLSIYAWHTVQVRQRLALCAPQQVNLVDARDEVPLLSAINTPNRSRDREKLAEALPYLFMVNETGTQALPVLPNLLTEFLGEKWKLRVASLRHHLRSHLSRSGLSGELINALLGHAERGQEPWGPYSTLPPRRWRQNLSEALDPLLDAFHLQVMPSPFGGRPN